MAIASLVVRIAADIADFEKKISGVERSLSRTGRNLENIGSRLTRGLTLPLTAGIGLAAKAAIDFESSFAGVRKTVDATEAQFKDLEGQFRSLARTMPLSVNEINKVAESAGQLGVQREKIVGFTETMVQLGATTNLTADEAATAMARFANALGQPDIEIDKLGASLVALGNAGASTETDILDMAGRIAGAGSQIKLTAGSIFGIANALSSVGIEAEKGGSAISRLFNDISSAVSSGGRELEAFAAVAGQSAEAFRGLFRQDSAAAITAFVEGLHAQKQAGTDLLQVLNELGITELRYRDTVLLAANAGPQFAASIRLGNDAFRDGSALTKEYGERLKTTESQLRIFRNSINDVLITLGQAFLPILNEAVRSAKPLVETLDDMATAFRSLPEGVRAASLALAGVLASLGPILYVGGAVTNAIGGLVKAFRFFIPEVSLAAVRAGDASKVFSGFLGVVGRFAVPITLAASALVALKETYDAFNRSTTEGAKSLASVIPGFSLLERGLTALGEAVPRLKAVWEDIVSIVRSSWILAFRELGEALETVRDVVRATAEHIGRQLQPVLDAIGVSWERVSDVLTRVALPAIKAVAVAFITSLPPVQSFLLLLSKVPGFSEIEGALDRVAKRMEAMVGEAERSADAVRSMGVVFTGGVASADAWGTALRNAGGSLTSASGLAFSFGNAVTTGVVKPLKLGGTATDEFAKKLKNLNDEIAGVDLVEKAKLWAAALKKTGAEAKVLADDRLRQDLIDVVTDVERRFGSLEKAGVGSLNRIGGAARALELALEPLENIPVNFEIKGLGQPGTLLGDILPEVPRSSLAAPIVEALQRDFASLMADDTAMARAAIGAARRSGNDAGEVMAVHWGTRFLDGISGFFDSFASVASTAIGSVARVLQQGVTGIGDFFKRFAAQTAEDFIGTMLSFIPGIGQALSQLAGPIVDFFSDLFDRNKGRDAVEKFVQESFGSFDALQDRLSRLGVEGERLWKLLTQGVGRNNPEQAADAIEQVTAAIEAMDDALNSAVDGVNRRATAFATPFRSAISELEKLTSQFDKEELKLAKLLLKKPAANDAEAAKFGLDKQSQLFDQFEVTRGLEGQIGDAVAKIAELREKMQPEFERLGIFVSATFAAMVKESGDAVAAIKALEPAFTVLREGVNDFGLESTATIDKLLTMFDIVNDATLGPIFEAIQATGQIFTGLQGAGYMTADLFQTVATDIGASFAALEEKGGDVATAMALSQPILQKLWEAQQIYGAVTDETTAKLLKQAEEQGLVGAHMKDVNQKILDVLIAIGDVFGAKIPEAIRLTSTAGQEAARKLKKDFKDAAGAIQTEFDDIRLKPLEVDIEYNDPGFEPNIKVSPVTVPIDYDFGSAPRPDLVPLASGGIVRRPTMALVGEAGPEAVIPLSQMNEVAGGSSTVIFEVDGRTLAEATVPHIPGVVRRYGLV